MPVFSVGGMTAADRPGSGFTMAPITLEAFTHSFPTDVTKLFAVCLAEEFSALKVFLFMCNLCGGFFATYV